MIELHDLFLPRADDAVLRHAVAQPPLDLLHALDRALEAHGAPQLLGLAAGEVGHHHRHAQDLLLEDRHAERAREDRLQAGMRIGDFLALQAALEEGVHHAADDRSRADDRHLDDEVVEVVGALRGSEAICARLSTWKTPTVSAARIMA